MILKSIFQLIVIIFIVIIPVSLIVLILTDFNEFKKKLQNIHKKK